MKAFKDLQIGDYIYKMMYDSNSVEYIRKEKILDIVDVSINPTLKTYSQCSIIFLLQADSEHALGMNTSEYESSRIETYYADEKDANSALIERLERKLEGNKETIEFYKKMRCKLEIALKTAQKYENL